MELLCNRCGAPLPPDAAHSAVTCVHCGTTSIPGRRVMKDIAPGVHVDERIACLRCADYLKGDDVPSCRGCGGVWIARGTTLDRSELERIAKRDLDGAPPDRSLPVNCPVCKTRLRPWGVAHVCDAHGVWFDRARDAL